MQYSQVAHLDAHDWRSQVGPSSPWVKLTTFVPKLAGFSVMLAPNLLAVPGSKKLSLSLPQFSRIRGW